MNEHLTGEMPSHLMPEAKDAEKRFGHNIEVTASFRRHFDPAKHPETGMSLDQLTDKGRQQATDLGKTLTGTIKGYASTKERAKDTVDIAFANAGEGAHILNEKLSEEKKTETGRTYNIRQKKELDTVPKEVAIIFLEGGKWADEQIKNGDKRPKLDLQIQYMLDHPERLQEVGAPSMREIAQDTAARLDLYRRMSGRLYDDSHVRLENGTHGPKLEPFLREVILQKQGDKIIKGFKDVSEIGGAFQPGENFEAVITRDEQGQDKISIRLRGKEFDVDMEELAKLSDEYKQAMNTRGWNRQN